MAEAHQGVAFTFAVSEDEGLHMNVSFEAIKAVMLSGLRSWRKMVSRVLNGVLNGVYPSHPGRGLALISFIVVLKRYKKLDGSFGLIAVIQEKIPTNWFVGHDREVVACVLFGSGLWITTVVARKMALQALFSYHGWMYEARGPVSLKTKVWVGLVRTIMGRNPKLLSYQSALPNLPVPDLSGTITRYLRTIKALRSEEDYARISREAEKFKQNVGRRLQRYLIFKSYISSNYVSDWWEEYVYLRGRSPIMVNSNFYALDGIIQTSSSIQAARAANVVASIFMYRKRLDNESIEPTMVQNMVPLCSRQYERQFNTTRIPGEVGDQLVHFKDSKHVAVYHKGKWFKLYTYYQSKNLTARELEIQIQKILDEEIDAKPMHKGEKYLASLTAGDRIPWAQVRKKHFSKGVNRSSLRCIERAAFVLILDEDAYPYSKNENGELDTFARAMLHGKGHDRWFDKSFNLIISANGRAGLNVEHTWADAPITGHLWEYALYDEFFTIGYDSEGHSNGKVRFEDMPDPVKLRWDFTPKLEDKIMASFATADKLLNDVDLHIYPHLEFGKDFIKKTRTSPDAFIQMACQLAYFRDIGKFHLTYEACMTRMFREGRTETVRSASIESADWVRAMEDPSVSRDELVQLFKNATNFHQQQFRDAMTGRGVDRHLFCLFVVSKYLEIEEPFLKEVLSEPWRLSTSQTTSSQTNLFDLKKHPDFISAGGGFGPVADDGYGVSYIISGEDAIFFHISSKISSSNTNSKRFAENIKRALSDVKALMEYSIEKTASSKKVTKK